MSFSIISLAAVLVTLASAVDAGDDARLLRREMQTPDHGQPTAHHEDGHKIERQAKWAERLERDEVVKKHDSAPPGGGWPTEHYAEISGTTSKETMEENFATINTFINSKELKPKSDGVGFDGVDSDADTLFIGEPWPDVGAHLLPPSMKMFGAEGLPTSYVKNTCGRDKTEKCVAEPVRSSVNIAYHWTQKKNAAKFQIADLLQLYCNLDSNASRDDYYACAGGGDPTPKTMPTAKPKKTNTEAKSLAGIFLSKAGFVVEGGAFSVWEPVIKSASTRYPKWESVFKPNGFEGYKAWITEFYKQLILQQGDTATANKLGVFICVSHQTLAHTLLKTVTDSTAILQDSKSNKAAKDLGKEIDDAGKLVQEYFFKTVLKTKGSGEQAVGTLGDDGMGWRQLGFAVSHLALHGERGEGEVAVVPLRSYLPVVIADYTKCKEDDAGALGPLCKMAKAHDTHAKTVTDATERLVGQKAGSGGVSIAMFHGDIVNEVGILFANWAFNKIADAVAAKTVTSTHEDFASLSKIPKGVEITGSTEGSVDKTSQCYNVCEWVNASLACKRKSSAGSTWGSGNEKTTITADGAGANGDGDCDTLCEKGPYNPRHPDRVECTGKGTTTVVASYRVDFANSAKYYSMQFHPEITKEFTDFRFFKPTDQELKDEGGTELLQSLGIAKP